MIFTLYKKRMKNFANRKSDISYKRTESVLEDNISKSQMLNGE